MHADVVRSDRRDAVLSCLPAWLPRAAWVPDPPVHFFLARNPARRFAWTPCSSATSEVTGRFVLADKEASDRERRHESVSARPDSDVVGVVVRRMVREAGAQPLGWDRGLI